VPDRAERGQRLYDRWSDHPLAYRLLPLIALGGRPRARRRRGRDALGLSAGERVLDLGCGPGVNVPGLAADVGRSGRVVALDYAAGMVDRAREVTRELPNATVVRGDAARLPFSDGSFDAAYATLAVSAMPEAATAVREARRVLRAGGRFVVLDARPYQWPPARVLNPVITRVFGWLTNWQPDVDVPALIRSTFDDAEVRTADGGAFFLAVGRVAE